MAYTPAQLDTYHGGKMHRLPLRSMDPSMLMGFVVRTREEWDDLVARLAALPKPLISVNASAPPANVAPSPPFEDTHSWADDGVQSLSDSSDAGQVADGAHAEADESALAPESVPLPPDVDGELDLSGEMETQALVPSSPRVMLEGDTMRSTRRVSARPSLEGVLPFPRKTIAPDGQTPPSSSPPDVDASPPHSGHESDTSRLSLALSPRRAHASAGDADRHLPPAIVRGAHSSEPGSRSDMAAVAATAGTGPRPAATEVDPVIDLVSPIGVALPVRSPVQATSCTLTAAAAARVSVAAPRKRPTTLRRRSEEDMGFPVPGAASATKDSPSVSASPDVSLILSDTPTRRRKQAQSFGPSASLTPRSHSQLVQHAQHTQLHGEQRAPLPPALPSPRALFSLPGTRAMKVMQDSDPPNPEPGISAEIHGEEGTQVAKEQENQKEESSSELEYAGPQMPRTDQVGFALEPTDGADLVPLEVSVPLNEIGAPAATSRPKSSTESESSEQSDEEDGSVTADEPGVTPPSPQHPDGNDALLLMPSWENRDRAARMASLLTELVPATAGSVSHWAETGSEGARILSPTSSPLTGTIDPFPSATGDVSPEADARSSGLSSSFDESFHPLGHNTSISGLNNTGLDVSESETKEDTEFELRSTSELAAEAAGSGDFGASAPSASIPIPAHRRLSGRAYISPSNDVGSWENAGGSMFTRPIPEFLSAAQAQAQATTSRTMLEPPLPSSAADASPHEVLSPASFDFGSRRSSRTRLCDPRRASRRSSSVFSVSPSRTPGRMPAASSSLLSVNKRL